MAAEDHLSGEQFMPITKFHELEAGDYPGYKVINLHRGALFEDDEPTSRVGVAGYDHRRWNQLAQSVAKRGIVKPFAVSHDEQELLNGHHRAVIAMEQGHLFVPVKHFDSTSTKLQEDIGDDFKKGRRVKLREKSL